MGPGEEAGCIPSYEDLSLSSLLSLESRDILSPFSCWVDEMGHPHFPWSTDLCLGCCLMCIMKTCVFEAPELGEGCRGPLDTRGKKHTGELQLIKHEEETDRMHKAVMEFLLQVSRENWSGDQCCRPSQAWSQTEHSRDSCHSINSIHPYCLCVLFT